MADLGSWSDNHLEPEEEQIMGLDWQGNELYGHEYGYNTDMGFVPEDDVAEYVSREFNLIMFQDTIGGY